MAYINSDLTTNGSNALAAEVAARVRNTQARLSATLKPQYDNTVDPLERDRPVREPGPDRLDDRQPPGGPYLQLPV